MKKLLKFSSLISVFALLPTFAFAAGASCTTTASVGKLICNIQDILNSIIPILVGIGLVYFIWGVVQYVIAGGEEAKTKGRDHIIYGIIGFAVIASFYGLVNIVVNFFGLSNANAPSLVAVNNVAAGVGGCSIGTNLQGLFGYAVCIINNSLIPLIFAVAIVAFLWGIVNYFILGSNEEAKRTQGRDFIIWGLVALVVMISVWGLVSILGGTFGFNTNILPTVKPGGSSSFINTGGGDTGGGGSTGTGTGCGSGGDINGNCNGSGGGPVNSTCGECSNGGICNDSGNGTGYCDNDGSSCTPC